MEIPIISSPEIKEIEIPKVVTEYYTRTVLPPPVVVNIGLPVVDIPGCVEAHETNNPKNNKIAIANDAWTVFDNDDNKLLMIL